MRRLPAVAVVLGMLLATWVAVTPGLAATLIPPRNLGELARAADAVILARALGTEGFLRGGLVMTRTELVAERVLSGALTAGSTFDVDAPGGSHQALSWVVPGSPRLEPGNEYLLFLSAREDRWIHSLLAYGVLETLQTPGGAEMLVPLSSAGIDVLPPPDLSPSEIEPPGRYWKEPLLDHLAGVLAGRESWDVATLTAPPQGGGAVAPAACSFITDQGRPFRWSAFDGAGGMATMFADASGDPSLADGPFRLVQEALDAWMQIPGTSLNLLYGGEAQVRFDCGGGNGGVVQNTIVFNDPCDEIAALDGCRGVLAFGGPTPAGTHSFDGSRWNTANGWIVVVNSGSGCLGSDNYRVMLSHELGHGLGFGHVDDNSALMFASCCNNVNATDRLCASYTYPRQTGNERPRVDAGEDLTLALAGNTLVLEGTAADDGLPLEPGRLTVTWSVLGGPGGVKFSSQSTPGTQVTFPLSGRYLLGLRATDGALVHADTVHLDLQIRAGENVNLAFRQGDGGYTGTVDTFIAQSLRSPCQTPIIHGPLSYPLMAMTHVPAGSPIRLSSASKICSGKVPGRFRQEQRSC